MTKKRQPLSTICKRCNSQFPRGGGDQHFKNCVAARAAKQYQRDMDALYVFNESYTTPNQAESSWESTSSHTVGVHEELDVLDAETALDNLQEQGNNNNTEDQKKICTTISTYLASLPGLDTEYIQQCINWRPRPKALSNRARLALKFLSCTCAGDGISKNHMKGILKFVKSLKGPDPAKLPHSIETCWSQVQQVYPLHLE